MPIRGGDVPIHLSEEYLTGIVNTALAEDAGHGDITSELLVPTELLGVASVLVKGEGILAGMEVAKLAFLILDPSLRVETPVADGSTVTTGQIVATVSGKVVSILKAERVALNFLQRLSGIASLTTRYVAEVKGLRALIKDTRKTTPGLRPLEKYAVRMGGGHNHRYDLGEAILIKDNHKVALRALGMTIREIVGKAKNAAPASFPVEIEVATVQEALEAAAAGADTILLDNMSPGDMRQAVDLLPGNVRTEASGGVRLDNVRAVAEAGVDVISVGALTHSPQSLDISLELEPLTLRLF